MKTKILPFPLALVLCLAFSAGAQVPLLMNFQGRVLTGGTNFHGTGQFKFALVNEDASTTFWSNDGTSVAGAEPTDGVALPVSRGLYSVLLGNAVLPNMTPIPVTVFTNAHVRLRIWFNDGVSGFQQLAPDQRVAAVGYAMMAANIVDGAVTAEKLADGAVTADKLADQAVTASKLAPGGLQGTNLAEGSVGSEQLASAIELGASNAVGRLDVYRTSAGTPAISLLGGTSRISTYGSDGLEQIRLWGSTWGELQLFNSRTDNAMAVNLTANGSSGGRLELKNTNAQNRALLVGANWGGSLTLYQRDGNTGVFVDGDSAGSGLINIRNTNGSTRIALYGQSPTSDSGGEVRVNDNTGTKTIELLGQATSTTGGQLSLNQDNGTLGVRLVAEDSNGRGGRLAVYNKDGDFRAEIDADDGDNGAAISLYAADGSRTVFLDGESGGGGYISVRNTNASTRVILDGQSTGGGGEIEIRDTTGTRTVQILGAETSTSGSEISLYQANGTRSVELDGEAGDGNGGWLRLFKGDGSTAITLDAEDSNGEGRVTTQVLQITGGSDLSENFDIQPIHAPIEPGMVVCIDPAHPGRLKVSAQAYDRTVAGVVSGAGGVKTGMLMSHADTLADGDHPVALTGRVYCRVDADYGAVQPGDLITTSATPGHGMKVADHTRAQGAILGKAMTPLEAGQGLVLVLVSLQ